MKGIRKIDICELSYPKERYGKLSGWKLCQLLNLPTFSTVYLIDERIDIHNKKIQQLFGGRLLFCRTDAPFGEGNNLPRGRNLYLDNINSFLKMVRLKCPNGVILIFENPYGNSDQTTIPRYCLDGGLFLLFDTDDIIIEFVGKGFDAGELTRGKSVHCGLAFPVYMAWDSPGNIFRDIALRLPWTSYHAISTKGYLLSRATRIQELKSSLGETSELSFEQYIPMTPQVISLPLFSKIYGECIEIILLRNSEKRIVKPPFGITINMYKNRFSIIEVWQAARSIPK